MSRHRARVEALRMNDADERAALEGLVGRTVSGRYRIDALLGMGGMGGVFRAHHLGLGQDVAIKVLRPGMRVGGLAAARFEREARSASRLDHPVCVRVTDFGELDDGAKFLVMELLTGEELEQRLGTPMAPHDAIDITVQILDGLAHAHARGVVHRDLKPQNVVLVVDRSGARRVKLVDFGIAKVLEVDEGDPKLTRTGMFFGTPRYMSPEQAGGGEVDGRTDLYAVGLLLYEMLAGQPPFVADDAATIMRMHVLSVPPPLPATIPPALSAVVTKLLAKARADRYADANEAVAALRGAVEVVPPSSSAPWSASTSGPASMSMPLPTVDYGPSPPRRRGFTSRQLIVGGIAIAVFWVIVAALAFADFDDTPPTAATVAPALASEASNVAPAPPPTQPPARPRAEQTKDDGGCQGDDCELECDGKRACVFMCGEDCRAECSGHSRCRLVVGPGSTVACEGKSECNVECRGACRVMCHGRSACDLRCLDDAAPGPSRCDKHSLACGPCAS